MSAGFAERCEKVKLTKSERLLSDYISGHFRDATYKTSTELADIVGISHSSVIRFAKDLGYNGFTELQSAIREEYESYLAQYEETPVIPSEKLKYGLDKLAVDNVPELVYETTRSNLQYTMLHSSPELLKNACTALVNARMKYIVGYRASAAPAAFLNIMLRDTLPHVFSADSTAITANDLLADVTKDDILIAIAFPRYNAQTVSAARQAHEAGAKVIAITDNVSSPLVRYSDYTFLAGIQSPTFFNSQTAAMFTAEMICTYACKLVEGGNEERLSVINDHLSDTKLY